MGQEIERKFLVRDGAWKAGASSQLIRQGYLSTDKSRTVRVRVKGEKAYLTIKGAATGWTRAEFEYEIPVPEATEMLDHLCLKPLIEKRRYTVSHQGLTWEIDEFFGDNLGLVIAEIELQSETQALELPPWVGDEVSEDPRYFNSSLIRAPFKTWGSENGGSKDKKNQI